jgi:hypothetical protein
MHSVFRCHNVARFTWDGYGSVCLPLVMQDKELYNGIPNVTVWRVSLHLEVYKLPIVQQLDRWIICTPLRVNALASSFSNILHING